VSPFQPPPRQEDAGNHALSNWQTQLQLLEQSSTFPPRQEPTQDEEKSAYSQNAVGSLALQDYQMQLMLLEQQNKNRLFMARQEVDFLDEQRVRNRADSAGEERGAREMTGKGKLPEFIDEREYPIYRLC